MKELALQFEAFVSYWHPSKGAGFKEDGTADFGSWAADVSFMNTSIPMVDVEDFQQTVVNHINNTLPCKISPDYLAIMDDGSIRFSLIEDRYGNQVDEKSYDGQMFICDYTIYIEIRETIRPSLDILSEMFPKAEKMF